MRFARSAWRFALVLCVLPSVLFGQTNATRVTYDYSAMYGMVAPSVVKIHVDGGSGSGFLVRDDGVIATNHHVVRNSRYIAVEFPDARKVRADVIDLDPQHDLALLKVNRTLVVGLKPLALLPASNDQSVQAGIPVVAFGSPLSQTFLMTQGIVSKVESGVLLCDFLIQPGNSGGPLVNLNAEVVGINTFAEGRISGAVRVNLLREALAKETVARGRLSEPAPTLLPVVRPERYSTETLKARLLTEPLDVAAYTVDAGKFAITAITPVLVGKAQVQTQLQQAANRYARRARKIQDEHFDPVDEPFYDWVRNANELLDYAVTFEIKPDFGQTTGSLWASALSAASASLSHTAATATRQTMEFKAEFQDFKLYRDGQLIEPITPGRQITEQSLNSALLTFVDEAYSGMYSYAPEVFLTGSEWRLEVYDAREPEKIHKAITLSPQSKLIQQIRHDFPDGVLREGRQAPPTSTPAVLNPSVGSAGASTPNMPEPVRPGGDIPEPTLIKSVPPVYPPAAVNDHITGVVLLEITVDAQGAVVFARVTHSVPGLDDAALAAVRQWRYSPTVVKGTPVPVILTVALTFKQ